MAAVPKRKLSKGRSGRRRAHLGLKVLQTVRCPKCGADKRPHHVCPICGAYKK